ncbi:MAG: isochorismatase family protein [Pirellulales bacterium]|nr:isochorismatase family protein [Pirellulales bacterium]
MRGILLIDLQNDYYPGGKFPLWNTGPVTERILVAMALARESGIPLVHIQHLANPAAGPAPFFERGTVGAEIHPQILAAAPDAPVIIKEYADSFYQTKLQSTLLELGVTELLVCGMMTQNCVTHTAISPTAENYQVKFWRIVARPCRRCSI